MAELLPNLTFPYQDYLNCPYQNLNKNEITDLLKEQNLKIKELRSKIAQKLNKSSKFKNLNELLLNEIKKSKEQDRLTYNFLMIINIINNNNNIIKNKNIRYERDFAEAIAIKDVIEYWRGFDPEKSNNPFAYFTSVITNGYAKAYKLMHDNIIYRKDTRDYSEASKNDFRINQYNEFLDLLEKNLDE